MLFLKRDVCISRVLSLIKMSSLHRNYNNYGTIDVTKYPTEKIRNFCIIAHVDHGKSTLADRLLEITGTINSDSKKNKQVLDRLEVERNRGITIKAQTASMFYKLNGEEFLLNLIDTPGHIDFTYEVSRSLKVCQGCILVIDATQGVQAQTITNFFLAFEIGIQIIPVLNKIDLKTSNVDGCLSQLREVFDINKEDVICVSAKNGTNCEDVLKEIIKKIPPPKVSEEKPFKALVFDSVFDVNRGAILYVSVMSGEIKKGDKVISHLSKKNYEVQEIGLARPDFIPSNKLLPGQVGYMICNMRSIKESNVGDTICSDKANVETFTGFIAPKPMVFSGFFPDDPSKFSLLRNSIQKLALNDSSVQITEESSPVLGQGYRIGFLGLLHLEVFKERLEKEYNQSVIITIPNVPYKLKSSSKNFKKLYGTSELTLTNPNQWPDDLKFDESLEPYILGTILCPTENFKEVNQLCLERRGDFQSKQEISGDRMILKYKLPFNEIFLDFFDKLKKSTSGFASFDYEDVVYEPSQLIKLNICLNDVEIEELNQIVNQSRALKIARILVKKIKEEIRPKQFKIAIQAKIGGKVIARETVSALRKDVTAKCYGGDQTRKLKLLKNQAEGKKRMRLLSKIKLDKNVLINILKKE